MISLFLLAIGAVAPGGQWSRRAYYDDLECKGNFIAGINVASAGSACLQTFPLISSCNFKSRVENGITSSEASGCAPATQFNDDVWNPSLADGKVVAGANYMVINQYLGADCAASAIYEQDIFLADGKCHAIEFRQSFYKASCPTTPGGPYEFTVCDDPACSVCTSSSILDAGTYIKSSFSVASGTAPCSQRIDSLPVKVFCSLLSNNGGNTTSTTGTSTGSNANPTGTNNAHQSSLDYIMSFIAIIYAAV